MKSLVAALAFVIFGVVLCQQKLHNASFIETVKEIVHDTSRATGKQVTEDVLAMGEKVKEGMEEFLDDTMDYLDGDEDNVTESLGIDSEGCNRGLRKTLEEKCDTEYDKVNEEAQQVKDEKKKIEAVCCALEDFEKCSLRAYDKANCATDKAAIRENLRAARLFLSVVANITCNEFRGQCAYYASSAYPSWSGYTGLMVSSLASLIMLLLL